MRIFRKKIKDKTLLENLKDLEKDYYEKVKTLYNLKRKGYKKLPPRLFDAKCTTCESLDASYLIKKKSERDTKFLCDNCIKIFNDDVLMNRIMRADKLKRINEK